MLHIQVRKKGYLPHDISVCRCSWLKLGKRGALPAEGNLTTLLPSWAISIAVTREKSYDVAAELER